ncbi:MAG: hypothetical protein KF795_16830 [Labilithrix sp.]|nr:hypothetical protein [Labilithrix sp.]
MGQRANSNPFLAPFAPTANPFGVAATIPEPPFAVPVPAPFPPPAAFGVAPATPSGAVDVVVDMQMSADDATHEDAAPSRQDLLLRAAELGPARLTWESIVLPTDPILGEKMQPRVAERRARFRKVVKAALGACVAFCVIATAATAVSAVAGSSHAAAANAAASIKTAPAAGVVPVETLDATPRGKAPSKVTATARPTPAPKFAKRARRR